MSAGQLLPRLLQALRAISEAVFIGGGATRSRTGLTGFAIERAHGAKHSTPRRSLRADRAKRLKRAAVGNFFPVLAICAGCGGGGTEDAQASPKLLVLGNSITFAPATPSIPWDHSSGMAASDAAHDFAHLVGASLNATVTAINVSRQGLEGNGAVDPINQVTVYPAATAIAQDTGSIDGQTYVVVELGDNVQDLAAFTPVYGQLLDAAAKGARLACVSTWWRNDAKDAVMKAACVAHGGTWVYIGDILPMRQDDVGRYSNPAVDGHPHDWSMGVIAGRVLAALGT